MNCKVKESTSASGPRFGRRAFTFIELLIALAVTSVVFLSLYASLSSGFALVQLARENLRATQILQEKMETIRLYNWTQINTAGFVPATFHEAFYSRSNASPGITYTGLVEIIVPPIAESYSNDLRQVTIQLNWESAGVARQREMRTYVSRHGLQNYIY